MHFKTKSGIQNLSNEDAARLFTDPDYACGDLMRHLDSGKTAEWDLSIQAMPEGDAYKYKWNIFDVTKIIPQKEYPLIPIGTLVLNKTPKNFFA